MSMKLMDWLMSFSVPCSFKLLRRNPDRRLGSSERDAEDVKKQAFFRVNQQLYSYCLVCICFPMYVNFLFFSSQPPFPFFCFGFFLRFFFCFVFFLLHGGCPPTTQLMRRNPDRRLGSSEHDAEDVKRQTFFRVKSLRLVAKEHHASNKTCASLVVVVICKLLFIINNSTLTNC